MTMHQFDAPEMYPFLVSVFSDPAPHTEEPRLEHSFSLMATDLKTAIEIARGVVDSSMPHHWSEYDVIVKEAEFKDTTIRWWHLNIEMARGVVHETMPHHWSDYDVIVKEAEVEDATIRWWYLYDSTGYPFSVAKIGDETCRIAWQWGEETVSMSLEDVVENPDIALSEASNKATWGK